MRMFVSAMIAALALPTAPSMAQRDDAESRYLPTPAIPYPGGVESQRDVTYAELSGFRPLTLDLYLPPKAGRPHPVLVFVHGGAWLHRTARDGGEFRDFPAVLAGFAARGYVVASVNYRFSGEAKFPGAVQDVGSAIQWLRGHAARYDIDPAHVVLWGSSAGGQIATLIGTGCDAPALQPPAAKGVTALPPCVQGVIDWYGLIDFEGPPSAVSKAQYAYLGCGPGNCPPGLARSASPLGYIDAKDPPFLIQHGTADVTVSPQQSVQLNDALKAAGVPVEMVLYPGVAHGFAKVPKGGPDDAVNRQALAKVSEFLDRIAPVKR
ncbi:alpha/beta hydrolase [Sphingomonas alpina]|uniref:Alpha/beta hydrolase n=1 Tax=Sphingomonas alpina TaxID=653931 RepID=A0A7H0LIW1_9SPHN|nr:alpha/beta hydrolase [Sphingomonas alpina]QNQ09614.1 alpha/beta hydrolase [Sphingomonas alpina]